MPESTEPDRCIFCFWDGVQKREIDPMEAGIILESECPDYAALLETVVEETPSLPPGAVAADLKEQKKQAAEKILTVTRKMFNVRPFKFEDGVRSGLTRTETFGLMTDFVLFLADLSKQARPFSTSRPRASPST